MTSRSKSVIRAKIRQNGGEIILSPLPGDRVTVPDNPDEVYIVWIKPYKPSRTINQNSLMWWTYRKESELINQGYTGPEAVTPEELYEQDLQSFSDATIVNVVPEAVNELKKFFRIVSALETVYVNNKKYIKCECWLGSSSFDKEKMSRWIEYRFRRLHEYGFDAETEYQYKQWRAYGAKKSKLHNDS